ncbi:hypothetical protein ABWW58_02635 [Sporolactobacillus sp. STCC-11]|uniref:hypothetical protein n=1 Tax=Sporolactobacillus caesalpiniae TaxID=3230362 RepID=UPI00339137B5
MVSEPKTIMRKVHFFDFNIFELQQGSINLTHHSSPGKIISDISNLPLAGNDIRSRFKFYANNDVSFLNEVEINGSQVRGKFAISRRSSLPSLETNGILKPLNIPANSGLAEITHFIYFVDENVIGVEFNFYGPRTNTLSNYLQEKSKIFVNPFQLIDVTPILNQDIDLQLHDMGEINFMQMEIAKNEINIVKELDEDLYSAFEASAKVADDAESVEVILRKKKHSRGGFHFPFSRSKMKELLSSGDNRQKFNKFKANAESRSEERNKSFDFLEDKMIRSKKVVTLGERSKSVDSESMFNAIEEAHDELAPNFNES